MGDLMQHGDEKRNNLKRSHDVEYRVQVSTTLTYDVNVEAQSIAEAVMEAMKDVKGEHSVETRLTDATPERVVYDIESNITAVIPE
jgi:hypothetical protein